MTKRGSTGQVSMEYFLVVMMAFMIIVPLIIYFVNESESSVGEVNVAQATQITRFIASNAEKVYAFGEPTTLTLSVLMPKGVEQVVINNSDISIVMNVNGRQVVISDLFSMNVTGNISGAPGIHRIRLTAINNSVIISE